MINISKNINTRYIAGNILIRVSRDDDYLNIVLDSVLNSLDGDGKDDFSSPSLRDKAFITRLVYGVVERKIALDYIIDKYLTSKKKLDVKARTLLRLGTYQLIYMDKVPASAAINETVEVSKKMRIDRFSGLINGILRNINRDKDIVFDNLPEGIKGLSIKTSIPFHLLKMWDKNYGEKYDHIENFTEKLAYNMTEIPKNFIKLNTIIISENEFEKILVDNSISYRKNRSLHGSYEVSDINRLKKLAQINKNWYYHQDTASQIACFALCAKAGDKIADVCAAPGGKAFTTAMYMKNHGEILAGDVHAFKAKDMQIRAKELSIDVVTAIERDACKPVCDNMKHRFDKVICDVPCSGLGAMKRKPEIRYKELDSFKELPELQYKILKNSSELVKVGGQIMYSTCTLNPRENEKVTERFLRENPDFEAEILNLKDYFKLLGIKPSHEITLFPHIHDSDGFYIAMFKRISE